MSKINPIKKAIILAGGLSSRLYPLTNDAPKCLLKVGKKTILQREIEALGESGVNDIVVVTGYKKEKINYPDIKYYDDNNYQTPSILRGLLCAEKEMGDGFIFSYSDIIYGQDVVRALLESRGDIALVVDTNWQEQYLGRSKHPIGEAELVQVENGQIVKIGKGIVSPDEAHGEFIGLAKFSEKGAEILKKEYHRVSEEFKNQPFQNASCFERAYLTDMLQELIDRGYLISNVDIQGNWMEIDTDEDLKKAEIKWKD